MTFIHTLWTWILNHGTVDAFVVVALANVATFYLTEAMSDAFVAKHPLWASLLSALKAAGFDLPSLVIHLRDLLLGLIKIVCKTPKLPLLVLMLLSLTGCSMTFEETRIHRIQNAPGATLKVAPGVGAAASAVTPPSAMCTSYDNARTYWGATSVGFASLAGAGGLALIPSGESTPLRVGLASGIVGSAAISIASKYIADGKAASWVLYCSQ